MDAEFAGIFGDNICQRGAMDCLVSDGTKAEISVKVVDILRMYKCGNYMSEPKHQHQNFAEKWIRMLEDTLNRIMDQTGAPGYTWLLCLIYVAALLNHLANANLGDLTPLAAMYGVTPDISAYLNFYFNSQCCTRLTISGLWRVRRRVEGGWVWRTMLAMPLRINF